MKKQIIAVVLSLCLVGIASSVALANGGPFLPDKSNKKIVQTQKHADKSDKKQNKTKAMRFIRSIDREFTDIQNDWSREEVLEAIAKGFVKGYQDATFRPNSSVSRLETLVMIINAQGLKDEVANYTLSDEQKVLLDKIPDWGKKYIAVALDKGILKAEELTRFNPQQAAKRYEVCLYMSRIIEPDESDKVTENKVFTDEDQIPSHSAKHVRQMWTYGIIKGYPDGSFQPMKAVKRSELVTMLNKLDDTYIKGFEESTIKGTIKTIVAVEGGYKLTIETKKGETVEVETNSNTRLIYQGKLLDTNINIKSSQQVKILLDENGNAVLVRVSDVINTSTDAEDDENGDEENDDDE
jgi:hypothetical protein